MDLNKEILTCEYTVFTGYKGKEITVSNLKIHYGVQDLLEISQTKKLDFENSELVEKSLILEDYYSIKGNLYKILMNGKNGWRI